MRTISKFFGLTASWILLLTATGYSADNAEVITPSKQAGYVNYNYFEGFETPESAQKFVKWVGKAEVDITEQAISSERKASGKSALKISIDFKSSPYYYLQIPLNIPIEGSCWISFSYYIESSSNMKVEPGLHIALPSAGATGLVEGISHSAKGKWHRKRMDLVEVGLNKADKWISSRKLAGITPVSCGKMLKGFIIMFKGRPGQHATVYLDDLRITGTIPSVETYAKILKQRKVETKKIVKTMTEKWRNDIQVFEQKFNAIAVKSSYARNYKKTINNFVASCKQRIKTIQALGKVTVDDRKLFQKLLFYRDIYLSNLATIKQQSQPAEFTVYTVDPINPFGTNPDDKVIGGKINNQLAVTLSTNEYEPTSIVLHPTRNLDDIIVDCGKFTNKTGATLPAKAIDIRVVKSWYQRKLAPGRLVSTKDMHGVLTPELLLYNDALFKVDTTKRHNYALLNGKYRLISERKLIKRKTRGRTEFSIEEFPIKDSTTLQPVKLTKGANKQFWITVFAPKNSAPGIYKGSLYIRSKNKVLQELPFTITVNNFKLAKADYVSSVYYRGILKPSLKGSISSETKSPEQYLAEMKNMVAHGIDSPNIYQNNGRNFNPELLAKVLKIRQQAGINNREIYYLGLVTGNNYIKHPQAIKTLVAKYKKQQKLFAKYGCKDLYIMGMDEAKGDMLAGQLPAWKAINAAVGKVFVAGDIFSASDRRNALNCLVVHMGTAKIDEKARQAIKDLQKSGMQVIAYAFPQIGAEDPYIYRRNFGLVLYAMGIKGAMDYAYMDTFNDPYNDFAHPAYKAHNFTYPTVNGVIDTIQWEGYREGMDDLRYFQTLQNSIKQAATNSAKQQQVVAARKFSTELLNKMRQYSSEDSCNDAVINMQKIRQQMIKYIEKLETRN